MSCSSSTSAIDTHTTVAAARADSSYKRSNTGGGGGDGSTRSTNDAPTRRAIRTGTVDSRWLFNHFYVGEVLIDTRSRAAFERATVFGAISIPPITNCTSFAEVVARSDGEQSGAASLSPRKRTLRDVVLFADREQLEGAASWLYTLQRLLEAEGLVASVKTLSDSFADFRQRYPFYTTDSPSAAAGSDNGIVQSGLCRVTYPNEIEDGFLYLGNMWQAESQQVLQDLGITHIVNATLDLGNVFESQGVRYHEVKVKDIASADISVFFDSTFRFIDGARRGAPATSSSGAPNRVLVHCTQGISRSATLVIMYLMRAHRWSLVTAFNHARAGRGVVIPNDGFLRALLAEERRLHGVSSNSIAEHELDLLLQGSIDYGAVLTASRRPGGNCVVM